MRLLRWVCSLMAAAQLVATPATAQPQSSSSLAAEPSLAGLDQHIRAAMEQWGTAGLSIAVVRDGQPILLHGFGVRDVRAQEPVDADTVFAIGSMTKSITAVLAGLLVDRGRLSFDDRLVTRVQGFAVGDPYITGSITVRDALSHRTGYDWRLDPLLLIEAGGGERDQLIRRLRAIPPDLPFRTSYGYSNVMYLMGSDAITAAGGAPWDELIRRMIFQPLGMNRSSTSIAALPAQRNVAAPHRNIGSRPKVIPWRNIDLAAGAGAINSSARDMVPFLAMMASGGQSAGRPFLRQTSFDELLTPHINMGVDRELRPYSNFHAYGLGWEVMDYKGRRVATHGGAIDGMLSEMAVVPSEKLGIVILTNTDGARNLGRALILHILDRMLGGERPDWNAPLLKSRTAMRQILFGTPPRTSGTAPSLPLAAYAGDYEGPYGRIRIGVAGDRLALVYGSHDAPLQHWHRDTFRSNWGVYGDRLSTFHFDHQGKPARMDVELIGEFRRVSIAASP